MRPLLLFALPALFAAPALTASSSVPTTAGGLGSATISGYQVSSIDYELDDETIDAVSFELAPATARTVRARVASQLSWTACSVAGAAVTCPVGTPVAAATALEILAAD